jgi:hypothetical protein
MDKSEQVIIRTFDPRNSSNTSTRPKATNVDQSSRVIPWLLSCATQYPVMPIRWTLSLCINAFEICCRELGMACLLNFLSGFHYDCRYCSKEEVWEWNCAVDSYLPHHTFAKSTMENIDSRRGVVASIQDFCDLSPRGSLRILSQAGPLVV